MKVIDLYKQLEILINSGQENLPIMISTSIEYTPLEVVDIQEGECCLCDSWTPVFDDKGGSERMTERETRTYKITMKSEQLNVLEAFFKDMVAYGKIGASRKLVVYVDGDGAVHPEITREDKQLASESDFGCGKTSKECEFWNPNPREDNFTYREDLTIYYDLG